MHVSTNWRVNRGKSKDSFPPNFSKYMRAIMRYSRRFWKAKFSGSERERPKNGDNGGQRNEKKGAKPVFDGPRSFRPFFPQSCLSIFSSLASQITEVPLPETERTRRRIARILLFPSFSLRCSLFPAADKDMSTQRRKKKRGREREREKKGDRAKRISDGRRGWIYVSSYIYIHFICTFINIYIYIYSRT